MEGGEKMSKVKRLAVTLLATVFLFSAFTATVSAAGMGHSDKSQAHQKMKGKKGMGHSQKSPDHKNMKKPAKKAPAKKK